MLKAGRKTKKVGVFLTISYVMLVLLALFSSLGPFFVYFFLGLAVFFLFLAARTPEAGRKFASAYESFGWSSSDTYARQTHHWGPGHTPQSSSVTPQQKKLIIAIAGALVVFGFFGVAIVGLIASEPGFESRRDSSAGDFFYNQGQLDSAYYYYTRSLKHDPDNVKTMMGLAGLMTYQKHYDSALYYYSLATLHDEDYDDARYGKAYVYYMRKQYSESVRELEDIIDNNSMYADAYLLRGDCYYSMNQLKQAISDYEQAYELGVRSFELCNMMANIYDKQGNHDFAIRYYLEALEYDDSIVNIHQRLGELLPGQQGDYHRQRAGSGR
jgi:Tfp pilus assembly protein PilF